MQAIGRRRPPPRGLALLVVLLLVALMGLGATAAVEVGETLARREREQALLQIGREFRTALQRHRASQAAVGAAQDPVSLDDLLRDPRHPGTVRHLRRIYRDPMTGQAAWGEVRERGRIVGIHSLSEATPIKRQGFGPQEQGFAQARSYRDWVFRLDPERAAVPAPSASAPAGFAPRPLLPAPAPTAPAVSGN